ncbi:Protein of unknown function [Bacillus mycoides]|uniref:Uncharacterized protein n=1 Tax=Bacillus mycoides TaxID=1405 RepID=A0A1G4ERY5_BACMY|nr:Protein of unknown function [Bacillus mycoides]
MAQKCPIGFG